MNNCEYPACETGLEVNEFNMCKKHEPKYKLNPGRIKGKGFDIEYLKAGMSRLRDNAPKKITSKLEEAVQEELL